ncbi:phosphate ABC transporter substrate-binding protein [Bacillus sp. ISL-40]|uniref:phosphate ABC transporter substrate-binding protein n=1 Tax=unclassified Bacillus (in: firmicutes) TaxID=185979 RepID=UPI001BEA271D|nr:MULTISPECIES: phosphate ABC transporter substrate-binding protein [unclassified Bacillus (in: firmicutes)]MBT2700748.1 phosphate ABC transporter substrate-binding protein [Bacillus sp. ISL-40]MBT2743565.1 phosphate ABC transporter substrate-binding protein [Bacillus sp. ISL-77]
MKSLKKLSLLTLLAALMVFMAACGGTTSTDKTAGTAKKETAKTEETKELSGSLSISGSSAMQPLVAAAAEEFMANNPKVDIQVNAGGSGTGLSQVAEGSVQIGNSDVFAEEKEGIPADQLVDHKVAVVGMTAAVNPKVGIKDIKKADLIKVFTGKITNWKELGGADQKIVLVNRPDSSGTRAVFNKFALDGATPAEGITEDSSNTVKKIINETDGAIGYLAFSYFTDESVTPLAIDGVEPTAENVQSGEFPVWAYQHSYTKGEPDEVSKAFFDYMMSDDVQNNLLKEQGYLPVTEMTVERDAEGNQKDI